MKHRTFKMDTNSLKSMILPESEKENSLAILFCAPKFFRDKKLIQSFIQRNNHINIIGCSTSGEILEDSVLDESAVLVYMDFAEVNIKTYRVEIADGDLSYQYGQELAGYFNQSPQLRSIFILSDGATINGGQLVAGINSQVSNEVVCTGGLAGDGDRFGSTWVIDSEGCYDNCVVAAGFYGDSLVYGSGSYGGWDVFGPKRIVTKSKNNILYEVDGEPALDLYKRYLGHMAKKLPANALQFPLQIMGEQSQAYLIRTIRAIDEEEKALHFVADIKEGSKVQLMRSNLERLIEGSAKSAKMAITNCGETPFISIVISCVGRRLVLRERSEEEIRMALSVYPETLSQVGFYSYGEIAPVDFHSCSEFLNQTMTITIIGEKGCA